MLKLAMGMGMGLCPDANDQEMEAISQTLGKFEPFSFPRNSKRAEYDMSWEELQILIESHILGARH